MMALTTRRKYQRRNRMATKAQLEAGKKYDKENTKKIILKLNLKTDDDILKKLAEVDNKQGYIKNLIRSDINK